MKILVLSHTRCGSTSLCKWLSDELNIELDETPYKSNIFEDTFKRNNIIRKIVIEEYFPNKTDIEKFDKIIYLLRENSIDAAISFLIANKNNIWHEKYEVSNDWLELNKETILKQSIIYDYYKSKLKNYNGFHTTYENLFINKKDLKSILNYFNIVEPKHLYHLEIDKKYRKDNNIFEKTKSKKLL